MTGIAESKKQVVKEVVDLLTKYSVIGLVDMESLPAKQLQKIREKLRGIVEIRMAKKRLIRIAIDQTKDKKKNIDKIKPYIKGMTALLVSEENPFKLYKILDKNKSSAPAKAGQIAPKDIIVKAGKTNFAPGPIISELAKVRIKTKVDAGKLAITDDVVVAKEGDVISAELASILQRLGIEPMEIGLNLTAMYEKGEILTKDVLGVDESKYIANIKIAYSWSVNLGVYAEIFTSDTTDIIISKAFAESKGLSLESGFITVRTAQDLLAKAQAQGQALKTKLNV